MKTNINNAIETEYKGYKFRSRLEARWAVFFDAMGVKWIYEPEGFKMYTDEFPLLPDGSYYLPDFYLPESDTWVEVKGAVHNKDVDKLMKLYRDGNLRNFNIVMVGDIPDDTDDIVSWIYNRYPAADTFINGFTDFPYLPCVCPTCGKFGFQFDGRGARICRHDDNDKGYTADDPEIRVAYKAARQARFEHGEKPVTESDSYIIKTSDVNEMVKILKTLPEEDKKTIITELTNSL